MNKIILPIDIDQMLPLKLAEELISIPSYKRDMEEQVIEYLIKFFKKIGIDYKVFSWNDGIIGITATIGEGPHSLMLHSHLDTVPPSNQANWGNDPFSPYKKNGKLYGLGACDDKGSLASMLATFASFVPIAYKLNGKLTLMVVGAEERGGLGTQAAIKEGYKAEAVILGEPTNLEPKLGHKGVLRLEITTKGISAHASTPSKGINAISHMSRIIPVLDDLALEIAKASEQYTGNASMATTTIRGGTALNVIPDFCTIAIDRRMVPGQVEKDVWNEIEQALKTVKLKDPELNVEMKKIRCTKPALTDPNEAIAQLALRVVSEELGKNLKPAGFGACCDMTFLRNEGKMPVIILGPGDIGMAHKMNEYIDIDSLSKAARIYGNITSKWLLRK